MHSDPIADMLTRIRNAQAVKKQTVDIAFSKMHVAILALLKEHSFIDEVKTDNQSKITVKLGYDRQGKPNIALIKRISKPGRRMFSKKNARPSQRDRRLMIISTSKGIMTHKEAEKNGLGGEIICEVY